MYLMRFLIVLCVIIAEKPTVKVIYMTDHMNTRHLDIEIRDVEGYILEY